jgi:hypothetical protein
MGVKGFNREQRNLSTTQIVEDTLEVSANGSVTFRTRRGKGSGKPIEISGDQFDTFVSMMNDIASRRESLAKVAKEAEESEDSTEDETDTDQASSE